MRLHRTTWMAVTLALGLSVTTLACGGDDERPEDTAAIPNPAAVFCEEQGGVVFGPEPMCELPDGSIVDAWEYFREQTG